jgi:hypothetical protein
MMSDERDPGRRILLSHILSLARFSTEMQARRGSEILAAILFGVFFAGLIATCLVFGSRVGAVLALSACAVGALGQVIILSVPKAQIPVIAASSALAIASLAIILAGLS